MIRHMQNGRMANGASPPDPSPAGCQHRLELAQTLGEAATLSWNEGMTRVTTLVNTYLPGMGSDLAEDTGPPCNHPLVLARRLGRADTNTWERSLEEVARLRRLRDGPGGTVPGTALRIEAVKPWEPKDFPEFKDRKEYWSWRCQVRRRLRLRVPTTDEIPAVLEAIILSFKGKLTSFAESADVSQYIRPSRATPTWELTQEALFEAADKHFLPQEFYQEALDAWGEVRRVAISGTAEEFMIEFQEKLWIVQEAAQHKGVDGPGRATRMGKFRSALPKQMVAWLNTYHYGWDMRDWHDYRREVITAWNNLKAANGHIPSGRMATTQDEPMEQYQIDPAPSVRMGKRAIDEVDEPEEVSAKIAKRRPPPVGAPRCRVMKDFNESPRVPPDCQGPLTRRKGMTRRDEEEARATRERCRKQKRCIRCRRLENEHSGDFILTTPWPANVRVATLSSADVGLESDVEDELDD